MRRILIAITALTILTPLAVAEEQKPTPDEVVQFSDSDAAMNAAIENARSTLPQFFAEFDAAPAHQRGAFALKVGMPVEDGHEHIWVDNLRREGHQLVGALANEPNWMPGMHRGSRVVIDPALISDWSIQSADGLYGSYTTRVMLPQLDAETAAQLRQMLTPSPTPAHWSS